MKKIFTTLTLALAFVFASMSANAQCTSIFNNITANSSYYFLSAGGVPLFDGPTCGPLYITPANVFVTGDLITFNVTCGNSYTWTTCGLVSFDSYIRIWEDVPGVYPYLGGNDDDFSCGSNFFASTLTWTSTFTGQIRLSVNEYLCNPGNQLPYDLLMQCTPGNGCAPPANDNVCDAEYLGTPTSVGTTVSWDNAFATPDGPSPGGGTGLSSCGSQDGWCSFETDVDNDIWFFFMAPASGNVDIEAFSTDGASDNQLALWQIDDCFSAALSAVEIAANDDDGSGFNARLYDPCVGFALTPGEFYYIQLDGYNGATGTGTLTITEIAPGGIPASDEACGAVVIPSAAPGGSSSVTYDNVCATSSGISPGAGTSTGGGTCDAVDGWCSFETDSDNDLWFSYTVPAGSGGSLNFSSEGDLLFDDTQIAVWDANGDCGNYAGFTELGANDDGGAIFGSSLDLDCLEPGTTYYIQVDGYGGDIHTGTVTVTDAGVAPLEVDAGPCATVHFTGCDNLAAYGCTELTASAMGGITGYSYLWSTGATTASITVCPEVSTLYTVTVTDQRGCSATDDVWVASIDVRCGPPPGSSSGSSDDGGSNNSSSNNCLETGVIICVNPNLFPSSSSGSSDDGGGSRNRKSSNHSDNHNNSSSSNIVPTYNICVACGCAAEYLATAGYSLGPCNQVDCDADQTSGQPAYVNGKQVKCKSSSSHGNMPFTDGYCYGKEIYKNFCRKVSSSHEKPCIGSGSNNKIGDEAIASDPTESVTAYPNPFDQTTTIAFTMIEGTGVTVEVYDITGVKVATLFNGAVEAGVNNEVVFDGSKEAAGIYLYKITTSQGQVKTDKLYLRK
jgi:hypothetical protein